MLKLRSSSGYSLIELLVSTSIMLVVTGAIFSLVNPAQGTSRVQPEFADMQQRARVGADTLFKDLVMAGAGPYQGAATGSLVNFFAPILPYRTGNISPDPPGSFKSDAITIVYVPNTSSQTTLINDLGQGNSVEMSVTNPQNCPPKDLCGFEIGMGVLIFDPTSGSFDTFEVTQVQSSAGHLQHRGSDLSITYPAGSIVVQAESHTYYYDANQLQLRRYDGLVTDVPVLDNVVGLSFTYYGDPNPPLAPKPTIGQQNCVIDASGDPRLPVLAATTGSLVELDPAIFQDGLPAWCGSGGNRFDPDLLRIRKIEVRIRVQTGDPTMRGTDPLFFAKPGKSNGGMGRVPDYQLRYDVSPRNLNLVR